MVINHLFKQFGKKEISKMNQCGRGSGVEGSIRSMPLDRFKEIYASNPSACCANCIKSAEKAKISLK